MFDLLAPSGADSGSEKAVTFHYCTCAVLAQLNLDVVAKFQTASDPFR